MIVISLNINIVNNHQLHNQILLNNVAEVDGKCKWSQLQRVFWMSCAPSSLSMAAARTRATKRHRVPPINPKWLKKEKRNDTQYWNFEIRKAGFQFESSKCSFEKSIIRNIGAGWNKNINGIYATKYKQMLDDLRDYAKTPSKFFRAAKGQTYDVANGVTRLVQSIRRRMKFYEDWGFINR